MTPVLLNNRYRVIRVLAKGGFGETFLVEDSFLPSKRLCVLKQLKLISNDPLLHEIVQSRFQREAAILEDLGRSSNQIPELFAYFEEQGQFYLVQEWIEGRTLAERVRDQGVCSEMFVQQVLKAILPIVEFIHSRGIIHRDIKPTNIILRQQNDLPVLIDFGAVKETVGTVLNSQGQTVSSIIVGTPGYMSAEQAAGRPIFSSDLFGLAVTAIYMLTGKQPQALPTNPRTGELDWRSEAPHLSPALAEILDRAIQYHPRDRFATAQEMLDALSTTHAEEEVTHLEDEVDLLPTALLSVPLVTPLSSNNIASTASSVPPTAAPPPLPHIPPTLTHRLAPTRLPQSHPSAPSTASTPSTPSVSFPSSSSSSPSKPSAIPRFAPADLFRKLKPHRRWLLIVGSMTAVAVAAFSGRQFLYQAPLFQSDESSSRGTETALADIQALQAAGNYRECIVKALAFPPVPENLANRAETLRQGCRDSRDEQLLQDARTIAAQPDPDLVQALAKAEQILPAAPVYKEAEPDISRWRSTLLQTYLREDVPKITPKISEIFDQIEPVVERVTPTEILISYDASADPRYADETRLRLLTVTFMEALRGDRDGNLPARYTEFDQLVVYSRNEQKQRGILTADQWDQFRKSDQPFDTISRSVKLERP